MGMVWKPRSHRARLEGVGEIMAGTYQIRYGGFGSGRRAWLAVGCGPLAQSVGALSRFERGTGEPVDRALFGRQFQTMLRG